MSQRQHGTQAGYTQHIRAKEPVCEPCRSANRDYKRIHRRAYRAAGRDKWVNRKGWRDQSADNEYSVKLESDSE